MQEARNLRGYKDEVREALDNEFQREALDKFALAYPVGRQNAFAGLEIEKLVDEVARGKDFAVAHMEELYQEFKSKAEAAGVHVHLARTAKEANDIIADIARSAGARNIIKSKSMTAEEILLNHHLEAEGFQVTETDLGEWIIQLRHEGPSHMVMPAIHLSRYQVADLFSDVTGKTQDAEIERLVKVARRELRQKFVEADLGVSGANFAVAETGTIGMTTNEGNARLVATLPKTHVVLAGLEKLVPNLHDALCINRVLPKNATGQAITSYVTWITGPVECGATPDRKKELHVVFLDNGRTRLARDPVFSQVLPLHSLRSLRQRLSRLSNGGRAPVRPHLHRGHRAHRDIFFPRPGKGPKPGHELPQLRSLQGRVRRRDRLASPHQGSPHQDSGRGRTSFERQARTDRHEKPEAVSWVADIAASGTTARDRGNSVHETSAHGPVRRLRIHGASRPGRTSL